MRARINLYQEDLFPVRNDWLDAYKAFAMVTAALVLFVIGYGLIWYQENQLVQEVTALRAQERLLKGKLSKMLAQPAKTEADEKQIKRLADLKADIRIKKLVLEVLSGQRIGNRQGFSKHFTKLAAKSYPDLWLTQIHLMNGGRELVFIGHTLDSGVIFDFVGNMTAEGVFEGRKFQFFQMKKVDTTRSGTMPRTRFAFGDKLDILQTAWEKDLTREEQAGEKAKNPFGSAGAGQDNQKGPMDLLKAIMKGGGKKE